MKDIPKVAREDHVIVLKTMFTDVWDNFNIHDLEKAIIQPIQSITANWWGREPNQYLHIPNDANFVIPTSALQLFAKQCGKHNLKI